MSQPQRAKFSGIRNVCQVFPTCFCPALAFHKLCGKSMCLAFIKDIVTCHPSFHFVGKFCVDTQGETDGLRDQTTLLSMQQLFSFARYSGPRYVKGHPFPATISVTRSPQVRRRLCLFVVTNQHPG